MRLHVLFALMDLLIILVTPMIYMTNKVRKFFKVKR